MKNTSKILALVLVVMTILMSLSAITASAAVQGNVYTLNANDLETITAEADNTRIPAGTDNYFTIILKNGGKIKSAEYSFSDSSSFTQQINFGGKMNWSNGVVNKSAIEFTTTAKGTVKVWWIADKVGTYLTLQNLNDPKTDKATTEAAITAGTLSITEFEIPEAGTWYVAPAGNNGSICKVEVVEIPDCTHSGGTATCKDQAVCEKCEKPYGELSEEHKFDKGLCSVCGASDPNACQHTNMAPATCTLPSTCADCGEYTVGDPLGHDMVTDAAVAPTCTEKGLEEGSHCSKCDEATTKQKEVPALGHTFTFVNTLPTATAPGKVVANCSVCKEHYESGEVKVMGAGTYVLDAAKLEGIAQYSLFDGEVKVVDGVFACHLSYKYRTDANVKTFAADDWSSTHRMNFGGKSEFCNNGEGDDAVPNGGLKNFIQIVTTGETTITIHWNAGGAGREVAVYDMDGEILMQSECAPTSNKDTYVTTFTLPAGEYLLGNVVNQNYWHKLTVDVAEPEVEEDVQPPVDGGETDDDDSQTEVPQPTFIQRVIAFIMSIIEKILAIFKK